MAILSHKSHRTIRDDYQSISDLEVPLSLTKMRKAGVPYEASLQDANASNYSPTTHVGTEADVHTAKDISHHACESEHLTIERQAHFGDDHQDPSLLESEASLSQPSLGK